MPPAPATDHPTGPPTDPKGPPTDPKGPPPADDHHTPGPPPLPPSRPTKAVFGPSPGHPVVQGQPTPAHALAERRLAAVRQYAAAVGRNKGLVDGAAVQADLYAILRDPGEEEGT